MTILGWAIAAVIGIAAPPGNGVIAGSVVGPSGAAVAGAAVFAEAGLGGEMRRTVSDAAGAFSIEGVPAGLVGVFAIADGYAYGGRSLQMGIGGVENDVVLRLDTPGTLTGTVTNFKKEPIGGARIDRVAIMGESPFSVPIGRLAPLGYPESVSAPGGGFSVPNLPANGRVALKVTHDAFAQEGVTDLVVGGAPAEVQMIEGVRVYGSVVTRGAEAPVGNAVIEFKNAQPPFDTGTARTTLDGEFALRLKPGVYVYRAEGAEYVSAAWERLTIQGDAPSHRVRLIVSRLGTIRGEVKDASTGRPVDGAKIRLITAGKSAGLVTTGQAGVFEISAANGTNDILLEAAPGYETPERPGVRIVVEEDAVASVPTFWLAPIPSLSARVVMPNDAPAAGVAVRLLRPEHLGWILSQGDGTVPLSVTTLPPDGRILGFAEHPSEPLAAIFAVGKAQKDPVIKLLPTGGVSGRVTGANGKGIEGAAVSVFFAEAPETEPLLLWRGRSGSDGAWQWNGAPAEVPLRCTATAAVSKKAEDADKTAAGESAVILVPAGGTKNVGNIAVAGGVTQSTHIGKKLGWEKAAPLCGTAPDGSAKGRSGVVVYASARNAQAVSEALTTLLPHIERAGGFVALVADGPFTCGNPAYPVLQGAAPSAGKTYIVDGSDRVVAELDDLPAMDVLRGFTGAAP